MRIAVRPGPAALLSCVLFAGCVERLPPLDETTSLRVELLAPTELGTPDQPAPPATSATIRVTAIDANNEVAVDHNGTADVYVQFLGSLTPPLGSLAPLAQVPIVNGVSAEAVVPLPPVFGRTLLWVEDAAEGGSFPTGTSAPIWFANPVMRDISQPVNPGGLDALVSSPLEGKQVNVTASRYGARGRLVVTSTFAQGYTLSDVECADETGAPPCTTGDFDHILIFSFSRPKDERGRNIEAGQFVTGFAGAIQEFNGLTEVGFPQSFTDAEDGTIDLARIPEPDVVQPAWFTMPIEFEKRESSLIAIEDATICPLDSAWVEFDQWKLDVGRGCGQAINVITTGVVDFDPGAHVGQRVTRVVGALRPLNFDTGGNIWLIHPRGNGDVILQ